MPKEEHCLMIYLVVDKGASNDRDRNESSNTRNRISTPMGFVQRSRLDFGLSTSPYIIYIYFLFLFIFTLL